MTASTHPTAATPSNAAKSASAASNCVRFIGFLSRRDVVGALVPAAALACRAIWMPGLAAGGRGAAGAVVEGRAAAVAVEGEAAWAAATGAAGAAAATAGGAAPVGRLSLTVAGEAGLGGRAIRTVSFFGCTLAA